MNKLSRARQTTGTLLTRVQLVACLGAATFAFCEGANAQQDRSSVSEKGSLIIFPHVEVRWANVAGYPVIQDTFLHLSNDYPSAVDVKMYFFNGDPPIFGAPLAEWEGNPIGIELPIMDPPVVDPPAFEVPESKPRIGAAHEAHNHGSLSHRDGFHFITCGPDLDAPLCEGDGFTGTQGVLASDAFGDSHVITESYGRITNINLPDGIRLPAAGNLAVSDVDGIVGNAVCTPDGGGGFELPCAIGAPGVAGTFDGLVLPEKPEPGQVSFDIEGYTVQEDDPDINYEVVIVSRDQCDGDPDPSCDPDNDAICTVPQIAPVFHPGIAIEKTSDTDTICDGEDTPVVYSYTVTNPGNVELQGVFATIMDDMCGPLVFIDGDSDGDMNLDPDETWMFECSTIVNTTTTATVEVTGFTDVPMCEASDSASTFIGAINCDPPDREHPGWNFFDNLITLTANEPCYWSAATGLPKGVGRWQTLDPGVDGDGPGRVDPNDNTQRYIRGFVVAFAVQQLPVADEIRWNHLAGDATIVNYREEHAWQYNSPAFQVVGDWSNGEATGTPGELFLDGVEYAQHGEQILMNFIASDSDAYSGEGLPVSHDTALTLMPLYGDFRQETVGPRTTKATFDIWNENEVKFTNLDQCVTCWSSELLSSYPIPNHFLMSGLHTDAGKARIDGVTSGLCAPENARATPIVGIASKLIAPGIATGNNLIDLGFETGNFKYDVSDPPPESRWDPEDVASNGRPRGAMNP